MKPAIACLALFAATAMARAEPVSVTAAPVPSFQNLGSETEFGALSWRGGLSLASGDTNFGGLSGLALSGDCQSLVAVSDAGRWFRASLAYDALGRISSIADAELAPILDRKGNPPRSKSYADAEAVAAIGNGKYLVGFESRTRVGLYDLGRSGLEARFQRVKSPKDITSGPDNGELESIGHLDAGLYRGYHIALSEDHRDTAGNIRGWLWRSWKTVPFVIAPLEDYAITDLAILPGGDVLILERSFSGTSLPGMAIRRFRTADIEAGITIEPDLIFSGRMPFYAIDNMEGIAVCKRNGETRLTIVSDNNFNASLQRTLLLQFAYAAPKI